MGKIGFWKEFASKFFVPTSLEKELIVIYFHNHCAKYSKYEEILNSASDLQQQTCSRQPHLPENWCLFPLQCGLDGVLPPVLALTLRHTSHRPCSFWCCQSPTEGEVWFFWVSYSRRKEINPAKKCLQAEKGKTYKSKAPETAEKWPRCGEGFSKVSACGGNLDYLEV